MKTVRIPKRKLLFAALAVVALLGVACVIADVEGDSGDEVTNATTETASVSADVPLTEAEVEAATAAAGHALGEIMRLDHAEGQEAWQVRIAPLCAQNGLAFWTGPLFAGQVWPTVIQREYTTQEIKVVDAHVIGEGDQPDSIVVEVTLNLTYTLGESDGPVVEQKTNQVVMVNQDGDWLTDGPPAPSYWSNGEYRGEQ